MLQELGDRWIKHHGRHFDLAILVLVAVNIAAALLMVGVILYDARSLARSRHFSSSRGYSSRFSISSLPQYSINIHPAEIMPLVISVAIIIQGGVFITIQTTNRETLAMQCSTTGQIVWPIIWLVPYTMLVFGLETTFRSLHKDRFQHQKRWNIMFCVTAAIILTLVTWVPAKVFSRRRACLASLVWWTADWTKVGLVLASGLLLTFLVCAAVIIAQLARTITMNRDQRISATRTAYYLVISASIMALIIPFFAQKTIRVDAIVTSKIAEVALNVLGIVHLLLHIFLRANADRTAIRPIESTRTIRQGLRLFGPSDLEMTMHITSPVLLEKDEERQPDDDNHKLVDDLKRFSRVAKYMSSPTIEPDTSFSQFMAEEGAKKLQYVEPTTPPAQVLLSPLSARKGSNYSIFPTFRSAMLRNSMSTTFSQDNEEVFQPPSIKLPWSHRREFSEQSSATVQIGCRLSNLRGSQHSGNPSPTGSSFRLPFYGTDRRFTQSPPLSPLSGRPNVPSGVSVDAVVLPIQTNRNQYGDYLEKSRTVLSTTTRYSQRQSRSRSQQDRLRRLTMKALPPDPPVYEIPRVPVHGSF